MKRKFHKEIFDMYTNVKIDEY